MSGLAELLVRRGFKVSGSDLAAGPITRRLEATLREQASELRQMAESLPILVWGCRPDGACDYVSRQWVRYTGVGEAEQLGQGWMELVHRDDRQRVEDGWRRAVDGGAPFAAELRLRAGDGSYRWFVARSAPIRDERGAVVKWYGTATDVDDLKLAGAGQPAGEAAPREPSGQGSEG